MDNDFLMSLLPTWHPLSPASDSHAPPDLPSPDQSPGYFLTTTQCWDNKSTDSTPGGLMFDSALTSLSSSPVSPPNNSGDGGFLIRELMAKLGSSSGEFSPQHKYSSGHLYRETAPKWGNSALPMNPGFPDISPVGKFSGLWARSFNGRTAQFAEIAAMGKMLSRVSSSPSLMPIGSPVGPPGSQGRAELSRSPEESLVSNPDKNRGLETGGKPPGEANWRKRKATPNANEAEIEDNSGTKRVKQTDGGNGNENGSVKTEEEAGGGSEENVNGEDKELAVKDEPKLPEPPKDYIHVRARRGQATDSHSLAERVRREKISERMKMLQDLVPGCNKVTGKALMLDEIINYVQSLQRQVEFLSMKLATVNSSADINTSTEMAKEVFRPESTDPHQMLPSVNISSGAIPRYSVDPLPQLLQAFRGDDLHSIVQMGYGQI